MTFSLLKKRAQVFVSMYRMREDASSLIVGVSVVGFSVALKQLQLLDCKQPRRRRRRREKRAAAKEKLAH